MEILIFVIGSVLIVFGLRILQLRSMRKCHPNKDPEALTGSHEEKLEDLRGIRDQIREKVIDWFKTLS
jgi:hypothetical protein